jgi:periodic tryptophan protein 1
MPEKLKLTEHEIQMMQKLAQEEVEAVVSDEEIDDSEEQELADSNTVDNELPPEFRMDEYDDEDDDVAIQNYLKREAKIGNEDDEGIAEISDQEDDEDTGVNDQADPEQEMEIDGEEDEDDELENDKEDLEILPTDTVILVANTDDDFSNLEVQVYDENSGSLYVHHEINLPAFPLALAWMDCAPETLDPAKGAVDGSFVAVGTFKPGIEIWNLDILDVLEPSAVLGGEEDTTLRDIALPKTTKRRKKKAPSMRAGSHTDSVLSLDWNRSHRNMLVSGSADETVKVWDITTQTCMYTMNHHSDKVQSVRWNPVETTVLASASFDRTIVVLDGRTPDAFSKFPVSADIESLAWSPHTPSTLVASSEDGVVVGYDVRMAGSEPLFRFDAHAGAVSAISFSPKVPGLFATAGVDKTVKIWDLLENKPTCITSKEMNVGKLFCMSFYPDSPFMLGVGGGKGVFALWDIEENEGVERKFSGRVSSSAKQGNSSDIASSFRSPYELGEELARHEEAEKAAAASGANSSKKKKKKKKQ